MKDIQGSKDTARNLQDNDQTKGGNQGTSWNWNQKKAKFLGITYLTIMGGSQSAESRPLKPESSSLVPQVGSSLLSLREGYAPQSLQRFELPKPENVVQSKLEAFSHPNGQTVQEIWPDVHKQMVEGLGDAQETPSEKTLPDLPSREMIPSEKTSQPATDAPSRQLEQGKSKWAEARELKGERLDSLMQSFLDSLKEEPKALEAFKELQKNKKAIKNSEDLMKHEDVRKYALSKLMDKKSVEQARSLLESGQAASLLKGEGVVENIKDMVSQESEMVKPENHTLRGRSLEEGRSQPDKVKAILGLITGGALVVLGVSLCCHELQKTRREVAARRREIAARQAFEGRQVAARQAFEGRQVSGSSVEMQPTTQNNEGSSNPLVPIPSERQRFHDNNQMYPVGIPVWDSSSSGKKNRSMLDDPD